jgi:hypothetical protein
VIRLQHAPDALVPFDQVADADLDCFNFGHGGSCRLSERARILHDL